MSATDATSVVVERIQKIIQAVASPLAIADVLYGDHNRIPYNRTVCVFAAPKTVELYATQRGVINTFNTLVVVYHCKLTDTEINYKECDILTEAIEDQINQYHKLQDPENLSDPSDPLVFHSYVRTVEPGMRLRMDNRWKISRLNVESQSRTRLPTL